MPEMIALAHGHGGQLSLELIEKTIIPALGASGASGAPTLDAASLPAAAGELVVSTDSYTVSPLFFPGGDIGKLAACGTLNDIAMRGARPLALSLALIIEEGFPIADLRRALQSLGAVAVAAGVKIITGDTKVVERGKCDGLFINTTGVGTVVAPAPIGPESIRPGDAILLSGPIGNHGLAILNARHALHPQANLRSDCAMLWPMVEELLKKVGADLHALRDPTRGGVAAVANEFARDARVEIKLRHDAIPILPEVASMLELLGMDPLVLANEGVFLAFVAAEAAEAALAALRRHPPGHAAAIIGAVSARRERGIVILETPYGTRRVLPMPVAEGLPRIC